MQKLILIKHASPQVDPALPSAQWRLSEQGRAACDTLAERLRSRSITHIITSNEPKAVETGRIVGEKLKVSVSETPNLHEHDRSNVPHMRSGEFISAVADFFKRPNELVLGKETGDAAAQRIESAVEHVVKGHDGGTIAIVTHGTVLSLLLQRTAKMNPFDLWRKLQLPSFIVAELPAWKVIEIVDRL